jgi:hypothetical protein
MCAIPIRRTLSASDIETKSKRRFAFRVVNGSLHRRGEVLVQGLSGALDRPSPVAAHVSVPRGKRVKVAGITAWRHGWLVITTSVWTAMTLVHPLVIGRRIEGIPDPARVRVLCEGRVVADRPSHGGEAVSRQHGARKSLEEFDFDHVRGPRGDLIADLGALDFVVATGDPRRPGSQLLPSARPDAGTASDEAKT